MYTLIHSFYRTKKLAKSNFDSVKKHWEPAKLVGDDVQGYAIVMYETEDYNKARSTLSQIIRKGMWAGFSQNQPD